MGNGAEMGPGRHLGAKGSQEGKKVRPDLPKHQNTQIWKLRLEVILETFRYFAGGRFLRCFEDASFSSPG